MALTKENYNFLKENYHSELERAYVCNYIRNMSHKSRTELAAIYQATFNADPHDIFSTCSTCCYNAVLRLAKAYFQYKPEEDEKPVIEEKVDNPQISNETSIEETEKDIEEYGTVDGLPFDTPDVTPEQLPAPDVTPEKEAEPKPKAKASSNKKATTKKK